MMNEHLINLSWMKKLDSIIFLFYNNNDECLPILLISEERLEKLFDNMGYVFRSKVEDQKRQKKRRNDIIKMVDKKRSNDRQNKRGR